MLIRKLLMYKNHPAVVYVHMWMPGRNEHSFYNVSVEAETELLVEYYSLQSISFRNLVYHKYMAGMGGFRNHDIACNTVHPTYLGHR